MRAAAHTCACEQRWNRPGRHLPVRVRAAATADLPLPRRSHRAPRRSRGGSPESRHPPSPVCAPRRRELWAMKTSARGCETDPRHERPGWSPALCGLKYSLRARQHVRLRVRGSASRRTRSACAKHWSAPIQAGRACPHAAIAAVIGVPNEHAQGSEHIAARRNAPAAQRRVAMSAATATKVCVNCGLLARSRTTRGRQHLGQLLLQLRNALSRDLGDGPRA
jgi:hypothetical protein